MLKMKFKILVNACALLFSVCFANAQYNGYTAVENLEAFKKVFASESAKILTISSNFTQEKILSALTEKIVSTGTFRFKRDNKVRIEYQKPFSYLMIMNGDRLLLRDDKKANEVNVRSNKLFQQINRIILDCIQGTILESKDFSTSVFEDKQSYLLEMTPVGKGLREFFQNVVLVVEKSDYSVRKIEMNEPGGDQTIITFTDKKLNGPVPEEAFTL